MNDAQQEAYEGAHVVGSDAFGLVSRDNRNHRKKQRLIIDAAAAAPGDRVLEVGCGDGLHAAEYEDRFEYVGVDLSNSLLRTARSRVHSSGSFAQTDATRLPFDAGEFDAVVGTAILHHLEDQLGALSEWLRVTRPGGTVTLAESNPLFPKDFVESHVLAEERHKRQLYPWRLRRTLDSLEASSWSVRPCIYTPPWPAPFHGWYDTIDAVFGRVPIVRWGSQMLLIHVEAA